MRGWQAPPVFVRGRTPPSDCWLTHMAQGAGSLSCSHQWAVFCGVLCANLPAPSLSLAVRVTLRPPQFS